MNAQIAEAISRQIKKIEQSIFNTTNSSSSDVNNEITSKSSVNDPEYILKLEYALKKNFDYIMKKDTKALHGAIVDNNGILNNSNKGDHRLQDPKIPPPPQWQNVYNPNKLLGNIPPPPAPPKQSHRLGIGTAQQPPPSELAANIASHQNESQSIYISGLPIDITQEEIEILFGAHSKIKKIKIYVNQHSGKQKGDALVTYHKPEDAITACLKLNHLDIGDGHVLNVVRADFSNNTATTTTSKNNNTVKKVDSNHDDKKKDIVQHNDIISDSNELSKLFADILPIEMEVYQYPVVIICNVFDQSDPRIQIDPNFLSEIETDMLVECCMFGNVRIMQVLLIDEINFLKIHRLLDVSSTENNIESGDTISNVSLNGAIAVTYEDVECAIKCAKALDGRWFDSKQLFIELIFPKDNNIQPITQSVVPPLTTKLIPPPPPPRIPKPLNLNLSFHAEKQQSTTEIVVHCQSIVTNPPTIQHLQAVSSPPLIVDTNNIATVMTGAEEEVEDVEDFLNSLL